MGLLNAHKADVHGMPSTRFRERMRKLNRRKAVGETAGSSVAFRNAKGISCAPSGKLSSSVNDAPCRFNFFTVLVFFIFFVFLNFIKYFLLYLFLYFL